MPLREEQKDEKSRKTRRAERREEQKDEKSRKTRRAERREEGGRRNRTSVHTDPA
jgi:hypothetical protein